MLFIISMEDLECGGVCWCSLIIKCDNFFGFFECFEFVELSLDFVDINLKVRCDVGKGKMDVCELSFVNRGSVYL